MNSEDHISSLSNEDKWSVSRGVLDGNVGETLEENVIAKELDFLNLTEPRNINRRVCLIHPLKNSLK